MTEQRFFSYVLVKYADEERDEALNVGLIVFDPHTEHATFRAAEDLTRIKRAFPDLSVAQLERMLTGAHRMLKQRVSVGGLPVLERFHIEWQNTLRASPVKSIRGVHIETVTDKLFARYVAVPDRAAPLLTAQPAHRDVTSWRVVRSLEARLKHRGLRQEEDFTFNTRLTGRTSSSARVPVHFPLRVDRLKLFEGLEVNLSNEELTLDFARSIASKTEQTFRSEEPYQVAVAISDRFNTDTGRYAEEIIASEGRLDEAEPKVLRYSQPDQLYELLNRMQIGQLELPRDDRDS